ncbi:Origin recognition complex subunit 2 [Steccherinum ochraceum]|uniref:Origin recognition complex subunit 2 n=1 Tax=Steccherinum ochraceum TaxID=92696 RepID=A0A4R0RQ50_9APHY|nr:Origin recognition complex subunit 2 [Steccherinum ochraceum]
MVRSEDEHSSSDDDQGGAFAPTFEDSVPLFSATSFDHYFAQTSKPSRTSSNVFSTQTAPLSTQEYTTAIETAAQRPVLIRAGVPAYTSALPLYLSQLEAGFNLLMYGAGSKRHVLNALAVGIHNTKPVHVVVANSTAPGFDYKNVLSSIESIPEISSSPAQRGPEGQLARISKYFDVDARPRHLYLILHNIDAPPFRSAKATTALSWLCANPCIHVVASVDNIAFPVKFSLDRRISKLPAQAEGAKRSWLWHDVTTLQPYDFELSTADRSSLSGASQKTSATSHSRSDANSAVVLLSPDAARHILLSVTQKAKKLFALLGTRQLQSMDDTDASAKDPQGIGMEYGTLFSLARENFIATNDTALRALMSEFRDHGLMLSSVQSSGSGELVWIPLRKKALSELVTSIEQKQL